MTVGDLLRYAFLSSGAISLSQTIYAEDMDNAMNVANNILADWQINRWLVYDLVDAVAVSTGAVSYTVGAAGTFVFSDQRPDKIDAAFARFIATGKDAPLFPFMSREGYDRFPSKSLVGDPLAYYYDPGLSALGTIFFAPVIPSTWEIHLNAKASLGTFTALSQSVTLPAPYIAALTWNVAAGIRSTYQLPEDTQVTERAESTLAALVNSIAQVPQAVTPIRTSRAGIYSSMPPPGSAPRGPA